MTNITIKNASPTQAKHIKSIIEFCINKLMPRMYNLDITVKLKNLSKTDCYGYCTADPDSEADRADRPRSFELEIHKNMRLRKILETVAHEMVHVKQYAKGELYEGSRVNKHRWHGEWLDKDPDYWDQPWEIEAHGRECGLFVRWAEQEELGKYKWTKVD